MRLNFSYGNLAVYFILVSDAHSVGHRCPPQALKKKTAIFQDDLTKKRHFILEFQIWYTVPNQTNHQNANFVCTKMLILLNNRGVSFLGFITTSASRVGEVYRPITSAVNFAY